MNVREIAFQSLLTICRDEGYSNIVVSKAIQTHQFADRDRRFYTELVYGTLRCLNYLDWIISQISTRKLQTRPCLPGHHPPGLISDFRHDQSPQISGLQ
jgi:16S rRNA (cytosine967-C5)-methyltransferase